MPPSEDEPPKVQQEDQPAPRDSHGPDHRSGFVAICGRPNVGKSTLLNALMGERVAVATAHPQTTRERLLGIWTRPTFQAVLVDTPGIHRARSALNRYMVDQALRGARDVDLVLLLAETPVLADDEQATAWEPGPVALEGLAAIARLERPILLVLTKTDRLADRRMLLPVIETWTRHHAFEAVVPTSAIADEGLAELEREIVARLPPGPCYYDAEQLTDRDLRWHAGELVRAELFEHLGQELPYSCAVQVTAWQERADRDTVRATVFVERDSQKGIVIGKGGRMIKALSTGARGRIAELTGRPCDLLLQVQVARDWTRNPDALPRLGYREPEPVREGRRGPMPEPMEAEEAP
ncbi:GTPase Era [Paraliomyxa miuraensis]|uniref:GTPase Era n=1 Tax=Paraliomyxa miuraensis TaxID=376150 RepID=UPI00225BC69C|nr:GTPase Era [Paraliomyxa miuraensis]MCX4244577.1 GTPase Era [Paraliomyxa miuraensis]